MYVTTCKINNSYTTYTVLDYEDDFNHMFKYQEKRKSPEWKRGAKVKHVFHGIGVISNISDNQITVQFQKSKVYRRLKSIHVVFEFKNEPGEVDSLRLCC